MNAVHRSKVVVLVLSTLLFLAINRDPLRPKDPKQVAYENWLSPIEETFNKAGGSGTLQEQPVKVRFSSNYPEFQADWNLVTSGTAASDARVLRILQLAREGQLFALPPYLSSGPAITLSVERGDRNFENKFSRQQVEGSLQAQALIKLLEVYAGEASAPPELSQP